MKNISNRLNKLAALVDRTEKLVDVGCDHGYLCIMLTENKIVDHCIAADINQGPLKKAQENIGLAGLSDKIETRLSDGLHKIKPDEADTIVIAGMGGLLMKKILTEGREVCDKAKTFILQPQSDIGLFRHFIYEYGLEIVAEDFVIEGGKYYPMIKAVHGDYVDSQKKVDIISEKLMDNLKPLIDMEFFDEISGDEKKKEVLFRYGPYLILNRNENLKIFLEEENRVLNEIMNTLEQGEMTEAKKIKIDSLQYDIALNEIGRCFYEGNNWGRSQRI